MNPTQANPAGVALPPLPTPVTPNPFGEALTSLAGVPGAVADKAQQRKLQESALQTSQAKVDEIRQRGDVERQARAKERLAALTQMATSNPTMQYDPTIRSTIDSAVRDAGLLDAAPTIDEDIPGASVGSPKRTKIDLHALQALTHPQRQLTDLAQQTQEFFMGLDPDGKKAWAESNGIYVSPDLLAMPAKYPLGSPQRTSIQNGYQQFLYGPNGAFSGKMTPDQFERVIDAQAHSWVQAGAVDQAGLDALRSDPTIVNQMGALTKAKFDQIKAITGKDIALTGQANSTSKLRQQLAKYYVEKTTELPQEMQAKWASIHERIQHDRTTEAQATERIMTAQKNATEHASMDSYTQFKDALSNAKTAFSSAQSNYQAAVRTFQQAQANATSFDTKGKPIVSQEILDSMTDAKAHLDALDKMNKDAEKAEPELLRGAMTQHMGGKTVTSATEMGTKGPPSGSQYGTKDGQKGYMYPDGTFHPGPK